MAFRIHCTCLCKDLLVKKKQHSVPLIVEEKVILSCNLSNVSTYSKPSSRNLEYALGANFPGANFLREISSCASPAPRMFRFTFLISGS